MKQFFIPVLAAAGIIMAANANEESSATYNQATDSLKAFNPAVSVIIDGFYYHEDSKEGISHVKEEISGFGHAHGEEEHGHGHGVDNGFNLRELELQFSAAIDDYFKASAIAAIDEEGAELEEAVVETTGLPWGFQVKAGKFFSDFGYINAQHAHQWDFSDQPLIYELALGDHGLNEKGVQVSWLAPIPIYLMFGAEALQGENEKMFVEEEDENLPENDGPRLGVGWVKLAPLQSENHELQLGLFGGSGNHQEIHDEGVAGTSTNNYLDGGNWFAGADAVYKYDSGKPNRQGDVVLQAEYFFRSKKLDLKASDDPGAPLGSTLNSEQDGYYIQGTYGILPRWRTGVRWEQVGLINEMQEPGEAKEQFGDSWRASAMIDFNPSENSQIRFQVNRGDYTTEEGTENVWEGYLQVTITLGAHSQKCERGCSGHHH